MAYLSVTASCKVCVMNQVTIAALTMQHSDDSSDEVDFRPLTAEQAAYVRASNPVTSPWWVVLGQLLVGAVLVGLVGWLFDERLAKSVAWGVLAVVLPAALFAYGLSSRFAAANAATAVVSFFVWELVKMCLTVGLMLTAHRLMRDLSWPAMLVGLVVTIKVYWLALALRRKVRTVQVTNLS